MRVLVVFFFLILCAFKANAQTLCGTALTSLVYQMQRGSLGLSKDPVADAIRDHAASYPGKSFSMDPAISPQEWRIQFEEDVLSFLVNDLGSDRWTFFGNKYGLNPQETLDVLTYYASRNYFHAIPLVGHPREVLGRLSQVSRAHRLGDANSATTRTYPYYLYNLTRLSVPEMADQLSASRGKPVSEQAVYREIASVGLSIDSAFKRDLSPLELGRIKSELYRRNLEPLTFELPNSLYDVARFLLAAEVNPRLSEKDVSEILGIGEQALRFFNHFQLEKNKSMPWNRIVNFEGEDLEEGQILRLLWKRDLRSAMIAEKLNELFSIGEKASPYYRTQASVMGKALTMGLTEGFSKGPDVSHPIYGELKTKGNLVPENVIPFLYDNYQKSKPQLAQDLQVSVGTLNAFMKRHDVVLLKPKRVSIDRPLSKNHREKMCDVRTGILEQFKRALKGFSNQTNTVLLDFAKSQITDPSRLHEAVEKLARLQLRPGDGVAAKAGKKTSQDRIHEALLIIAEGKTGERPDSLVSDEHGHEAFGLDRIPEPTSVRKLAATEMAQMKADHDGILVALLEHLVGFGSRTDELIPDFAAEQIKDPDQLQLALKKIAGLGLKSGDGHAAMNGKALPMARIQEALVIIAEHKTGRRPNQVVSRDHGAMLFGMKALGTKQISPSIPAAVRTEMENPKTGILEQLTFNLKGVGSHSDSMLLAFAALQLENSPTKAETLKKVQSVGLRSLDVQNAKNGTLIAQDRVHEVLLLIAEGKTGKRPTAIGTSEIGTALFGLKAIPQETVSPNLSDVQRAQMVIPDKGIVSYFIGNLRGFSSRTPEVLEDFARAQITDSAKLAEVIAKIQRLGITKGAGGQARLGKKSQQNRIHEALMLIAEAKTGARPVQITTIDEARAIFRLE